MEGSSHNDAKFVAVVRFTVSQEGALLKQEKERWSYQLRRIKIRHQSSPSRRHHHSPTRPSDRLSGCLLPIRRASLLCVRGGVLSISTKSLLRSSFRLDLMSIWHHISPLMKISTGGAKSTAYTRSGSASFSKTTSHTTVVCLNSRTRLCSHNVAATRHHCHHPSTHSHHRRHSSHDPTCSITPPVSMSLCRSQSRRVGFDSLSSFQQHY
ncbi:hypothetical protein TcWFU_007943 [Taenia crassiceps]|uniref:Uncharacterized protein n=1 Tax=Taenia crassiceps TaxID=6207 RepID=A0ABR4Q0R1_9CEST